jgi:hypothetical protein
MRGGDVHSKLGMLKRKFELFQTTQQQRMLAAWNKLEKILLKSPAIVAFLDQFGKGSLQLNFQYCLIDNAKKAELFALFTRWDLYKNYNQFEVFSRQSFDLDSELLDKAVIHEYAARVENPKQWLTAYELAIIAYSHNITINYYTMLTDICGQFFFTGGMPFDIYNPGASSAVNVYFNGSDHYLRAELPKVSSAAALVEAKETSPKPVVAKDASPKDEAPNAYALFSPRTLNRKRRNNQMSHNREQIEKIANAISSKMDIYEFAELVGTEGAYADRAIVNNATQDTILMYAVRQKSNDLLEYVIERLLPHSKTSFSIEIIKQTLSSRNTQGMSVIEIAYENGTIDRLKTGVAFAAGEAEKLPLTAQLINTYIDEEVAALKKNKMTM